MNKGTGKINLGDYVKDTITGYKGMCRKHYDNFSYMERKKLNA